MANFNSTILTKQGLELLTRVQAGETGMQLTKAVTGNGTYTQADKIAFMTALKNPKQEFGLNKITIINQSTLRVKFIITNAPKDKPALTQGYHISEIGLYAQDDNDNEILYAVATSADNEWDYLPAYNDLMPSAVIVDMYTEVCNAENVTMMVHNGIYATEDEMDETNARIDKLDNIADKLHSSAFDGNASKINGHTVNADVPANAKFTDTHLAVVDNLTSDSTTDALSPRQGKILNEKIEILSQNMSNSIASHTHSQYSQVGHTHDYAASNHTHNNYALTNHTHNYASASHTHSGYASASHTHAWADITNKPSSSDSTGHNHSASQIDSGTLSADRLPTIPVNKGGTGATTANEALSNLGAVPVNSSNILIGGSASVDDCSISIGYQAQTKLYSVAVGLGAVATGNRSIAIGENTNAFATSSIAIGGNNGISGRSATVRSNGLHGIALGFGTIVSASGATAIGNGAVGSTEDGIQLGNNSVTASLSCRVALTVTSDKRDKIVIDNISNALSFLDLINPIRFRYNHRELYISRELDEKNQALKDTYGLCDYDREAHAKGSKAGQRIRVGVIAQEVQEALKEVYGDESYGNLVNDNFYDYENKDDIPVENQLGVTYENFVPFLIKAVQELNEKNNELEKHIETLEEKFKPGHFESSL